MTFRHGAGAFMLLDTWQRAFDVSTMEVVFPITIGAVGLVLTGAAGFLGWKLVQTQPSAVRFPASSRFPFVMNSRASSIDRSKVACRASCCSSVNCRSFGSIRLRRWTSANAVSASA